MDLRAFQLLTIRQAEAHLEGALRERCPIRMVRVKRDAQPIDQGLTDVLQGIF
jgi:hypothetical protein